ncbi:AAA family ATPase [Caldithrix abyssi DSM 13497]|uniref:AAA family ATPase n=1 Tax=Caldithrix abyssi DSM 13497 TaxID=880073 RepID=H1XVE9_CALAY|nr:ATP-binding protein [Caldithrix abyssi]APF17621.1 hypothetical protein Cabys_870 [Caldithrix abyssi DSM 13497]EHO41707.1 AAA family ATPase [Caldithrix abyssi DSM 13497]
MIKREISDKILELSEKFPVISIIGPRQSGKTTLVKALFPDKHYVNLEEPDTRLFAIQDPRAFLSQGPKGLIIDEAQRVPELFSYIQSMVDRQKRSGQFILTGSQHFLLHEKVSQSLAGRVALFKLLPFSLKELFLHFNQLTPFGDYLFKGFYPPIYDRQLRPTDWYSAYVSTYVERDVRQLLNIKDLDQFTLFLKLCAGRIGQLLNYNSLANELGIAVNTVKGWISVLKASFVVFTLMPYYKSYNKRLVKSQKLYFYDVGLASYLLGIRDKSHLQNHFLRGELFENLVIADLIKFAYNNGFEPNFYFWRDQTGHEIDLLIDTNGRQRAFEIKTSSTISTAFFKNLTFWQKISGNSPEDSVLIYTGESAQKRSQAHVLPWHRLINPSFLFE